MNGSRVGLALATAALLAAAEPGAAQDVGISLSWGSSSNFRASGYYLSDGLRVVGHVDDARYARRPVRYVERRHFEECVAEGPYLYCWEAPRYYRERPVVFVDLADRHYARRHHPRGRGWEKRWERQQRALAARYWRRWADGHRYRYDRDRLIVDVAFAW
jgi:hypothetical protein